MPFNKFCPTRPAWGASMLELLGPRGKLKGLLDCSSVIEELKRRGHDVGKEFGVKVEEEKKEVPSA